MGSELRQLSREGLKELGTGRSATVYALSDKEVLKVFLPSYSVDKIRDEYEITRKVSEAGIRCAKAIELVEVEGRPAVIYERISADNIGAAMFTAMREHDDKDLTELVDYYVSFMKKLHSIELPEGYFPDIRKRFADRARALSGIRFDEAHSKKIIDWLESEPVTCHYLHGDFNPTNVPVMGPDPVLFDVGDAALGDPVFEFAFMNCADLMEKIRKGMLEDLYGLTLEMVDTLREKVYERYYEGESEESMNDIRNRAHIAGNIYLLTMELGLTEYTDEIRQFFNAMIDQILP
ncbi:MAG: phosphotransferase [Lachnospiraceae bacterium]|nr:phosphotransferase [Lachnospiraceae bacterium]